MNTTLNKIRKHEPCTSGWKKLLIALGKHQADDEPLALITILDLNGLDDALWCLRAVDGHEKEKLLYAVWCARQVQYLMDDKRSLDALDIAERFANGEATEKELDAAWAAAWAAALNARGAAWNPDGDVQAAMSAAVMAAAGHAWEAALKARDAPWDAGRAAVQAQEDKFRKTFGHKEQA